MKEPLKYRQNKWGKWILTDEWKLWRKQRYTIPGQNKPKKIKGRPAMLTQENHKANWKEVAWFSNSDKQILFCACRSGTGIPFAGCGGAAIRNGRQGKLHILIEPRFE